MMAHPGGRAGGGIGPPAGPAPEPKGEPTTARRFNRKPLSDERRNTRRQADRDRIEQAGRALLTTDGWHRWIKVRANNGPSRYSLVYPGVADVASGQDPAVSFADMSSTRLDAVCRLDS